MDFLNLIQPAIETLQTIGRDFIALIPGLVLAIIVFVLTFVAAGFVRTQVSRVMNRSKLQQGAVIVLSRMARVFVIIGGILIASSIVFPDLGPTQLLELLGIGSIAIGFAFQDIFENFLAGILILVSQPFRIGDQIIAAGYEGTVEEIETRATKIRTYDGRRVVIPNSQLFTGSVTVITAFDKVRSQYDVGIGYDEDIETARSVMVEAMKGLEGVYDNPEPAAIVVDLGASAVVLRLLWWTHPSVSNRVAGTDRVITAVKYALDDAGIEIPYNYINVVQMQDGSPIEQQ